MTKVPDATEARAAAVEPGFEAEQSLSASERSYREIFNAADDAIFIHDADTGAILDVNQAMCELYGLTREEALARSVEDLSQGEPPYTMEHARQWVRKATEEGPQRFEWWSRRLDGTLFWAEVRMKRAVIGGRDRILALVRDISDRKRAEQELRGLSSRHEAILASVPDIIMEVDENRIYTWANRAGLDFFGEDVVGTEASHYFEGRQDTYEVVSPLFRGQTDVIHLESWQRRKDGEKRLLAWWCRVLTDADGKVLGALSTARDITEQRQAEELREQLARTLEQKNKELESIVYVASHDLRGPLVNIEGFSRELAHACQTIRTAFDQETAIESLKGRLASVLAEDVPQALDFIQIGAAKMDAVLNGLLRLSRLGQAALRIENLDMNAMLTQVAKSMEFQVKQAGATLQVEELPPCRGDAVQIGQVFSNLLENALKYLDPSRAGAIHVSGKVESGRAVYCVEDNGIGIAPQHQAKVFDILHRLDPSAGPGEGLGLTIARRILDRHDGEIWLESEVGKGSRFLVSLPAAAERNTGVETAHTKTRPR